MSNILNCPSCGNEIQKEDQFCGCCGTKLVQEKQVEKAEEKQEKTDKTQKKSQKEIKLIGGIIVCLLLIVSAVNIGRLTEENYRNDTRSKNSYSSEVPMPAGITSDEDYEQDYEQEEEQTTQTQTGDPYANAMKEYNDIETVRKQLDYYVNLLPEAVTTEAMGGRPPMSSAEIQMKITELNSKLMSFSGQ